MDLLKFLFITYSIFFLKFGYSQVLLEKSAIENQLRLSCPQCQINNTSIQPNIIERNDIAFFHNGHISYSNGDYVNAQKHLINLTDSNLSLDISFLRYYMLGFIYKKSFLIDKSVNAFENSLATHSAKLSDSIKNRIYIALGFLEFKQKKFKKALENYDCVENNKGFHSDFLIQKALYNNKAILFLYDKKFKKAEAYHLKEIEIDKKLNDTSSLAISYMNLGNLYYEQYLDSMAIPLFKKSLELAKTTDNLALKKNTHLNMAVVSEDAGNFKEALMYRKEYEKLNDSIYNRDKVWELAEQEKQFAIGQKQNELDVQTANLKVSRQQRTIFLIATIAFLLLSFITFRAYKSRIRKNRIINKQKEELEELNSMKNRLFSVVAHDLRSPVYSMKEMNKKFEKAFINDDKSSLGNLINSSRKITDKVYSLLDNLLHWALEQTKQLHFHKEKLYLKTIVEQVAFDFKFLAEQKEISLDIKIPENTFVNADYSSLKIALRNLLDNAIKYTPEKGSIKIRANKLKNGNHRISIADSGLGMDVDTLEKVWEMKKGYRKKDTYGKTSTGIGLWLSKTMVEKNNANLSIESKKGKGTKVMIEFDNALIN